MDGRGTAGRQEQFVSIRAALLRTQPCSAFHCSQGGGAGLAAPLGCPGMRGPWCVPRVASGTAAVAASAADVCWGEEIWLPDE